MIILGYILALLVGLVLGLVGSGGAILTLPILVYLFKIDPIKATTYSLFIVCVTSCVGGINYLKNKMVNWKAVISFGIPSIITVSLTRAFIIPNLPEFIYQSNEMSISSNRVLMFLFSCVLFLSAYALIRPSKQEEKLNREKDENPSKGIFFIYGSLVGLLSGLVGAGGGFLIVPAFVLVLHMNMKNAVASSLILITINSFVGFIGDLFIQNSMDWKLLSIFSLFSIAGIFLGIFLTRYIEGNRLKSYFGYMIIFLAAGILFKEMSQLL